ncbi:MAG: L-histidine N(alpha)-methyltransferase [Pseudomonadales bacterium]
MQTSTRSPSPSKPGTFRFFDLQPRTASMLEEVLAGLTEQPKQLPPKYFYDAAGSVLFEHITRLPEYYLTRTELALFDAHLDDLARALGNGICLVEYGSGTSEKIRKLLERLRPVAYVPVDISGEHLEAQARALHEDFPWLDVFPTCADFTGAFTLPAPVDGLPRVGFFPGSSIGNFDPAGAERFLRNVGATIGAGGRLLVGVDRKKDVAVIERAYNDTQGVTAEFNLNVLNHINQRLGADFVLEQFAHEARYNPERGCIQMFLRSRSTQTVRIGETEIALAAGEAIHTENSFKYHPEEFIALAQRGGFESLDWWTDEDAHFALFLLRAL